MRILVTNDDGINAPGLRILERVAEGISGNNDVWTVAPIGEQSGVAHGISLITPMMITQLSERRFGVKGTPADCVLAGLLDVLKQEPPDLVLAGINRGNNSGENALYSGTVGAAIEAALHGVKAIALSQYFGPRNRDLANPFESAEAHARDVIAFLLESAYWDSKEYKLFFNVNFPPVPARDVAGHKIVKQGLRRNGGFAVLPQVSPGKRRYLWITTGDQSAPATANSDVAANLENQVAITPMRADLTAHDALQSMQANCT